MNTEYEPDGKKLFFKISEEIDHHEAEKIRRKADDEITKYMPRKVIFDFNNVSFMDSAGIGMVLGRYKMMNMLGGSIEMINVSPKLRKIFDLSGITKVIPIGDTKDYNNKFENIQLNLDNLGGKDEKYI